MRAGPATRAEGMSRTASNRILRRLSALALTLAGLAGVSASVAAQEYVARDGVRVGYWDGQRGRALEVLDVAATPADFPGIGRVAAPESTTVLLAPSPAAYREMLGGAVPEWAGGIAIPEERLIVLPGYPSARAEAVQATALVRHEVAHLVLHHHLGKPAPRWFAEGYAEIASGTWDVESAWQLRMALALGQGPQLDSLAMSWPRGAERARFAYLVSATAVQHIADRAGPEGFRLLLSNWRTMDGFDPAVRATFGMTRGQLEDEWRDAVRVRYGWLQGVTHTALVWVPAVVLLLLAYIPRRRANRRKLAEMEAENRMLPPPRPDGLDVEYPLPVASSDA